MLLKNRKFIIELDEDEIRELREALDQRLETLDEVKGGGVLWAKHLERTEALFNMVDFLRRECDHGFNE